MQDLKNKVAVITGGSSGIGLAIAKLFAKEKAKVVITGRSNSKLAKAKNKIKSDSVLTVQGNIGELSAIELLYNKVKKQFGNIDILVANAGIGKVANVSSVNEEFFDSIVNVNYKAVFFTVQKAIKFLNKNSSVILVSSVQSHMGMSGRSVYASTKAAVTQLAKNFAADLIEKKIRVNSISPGYTQTPILKKFSDEYIEKLAKKIPMKKLATPEQISQVVLFLASDMSSYITGTDIVIDGGLSKLDFI